MARAGALPRPPVVTLPAARVRRWRLMLVLAALAVAHVIGWRTTKIDLPELATGWPRAQHIVLGLLQPDSFARVHDDVTQSGQFTILAPTAPTSTGVIASSSAGTQGDSPTLTITPAEVKPDQIVNVQGRGWPAGKQGEVFLAPASGSRLRSAGKFTVSPEGVVNYAFYAPAYTEGTYALTVVATIPHFGWFPTDTLRLCFKLMVETLFLALMGTSLAVLFSVPLAFLGARNLMGRSRIGRGVYYTTRIIFNLLRSIEVVIIVTIMAVVVGIGSFAGVLALVIHSIGSLGKLYSEAIEGIDPGPIEAITATGAHPLQVVRYAVVPQVVPQFLSFTLYRMDVNVRMSTIVGMVGGGGIGFILTQYINLLQWNQAGTAIWLIAIVVTAFDYLSSYLREKII